MDDPRINKEAAWALFHALRNGPTFTEEYRNLRHSLAESQNWRCAYCGCEMETEGSGKKAVSIEHIRNRGNGGVNLHENLVAACWWCNNSRGPDRSAEAWFAEIQSLIAAGEHPNHGR